MMSFVASSRLIVSLLGIAITGQSYAQSAPAGKFADPTAAASLPASGVSSMGQVTVALVIVLAVLFAAAWAMRQFKLFNRPGQGALEVVQGISVGPKERAVLIKINGRPLLLGVAPGSVNLLLELPADAGVDSSSGEPTLPTNSPSTTETPNFKALLKNTVGRSLGLS